MKLILVNIILIIGGCAINQSEIWYTHMINPKYLPIEFKDESGKKHQIETGNYVELKGNTEDNWIIQMLVNGNLKTGQIPRNSENGNPTLVYLEKFDRKNKKGKSFCSEVQLQPQKAITLRTRPLTNNELKEMLENRSSKKSKEVNRKTAIFGIQHGVEFELIDDDFGTWQKIKIQTKNKEFIGFINKEVKGIQTRKNNCK